MVLGDLSLWKLLNDLVRDPEPDPDLVNPASIDVRIGPEMLLEVGSQTFRPVSLTAGPVELAPGDFALVSTLEWLTVPNGYAVELRLKAGVAQQMLYHVADRPRALVCANDEIALGALTAAEELGLHVPDDVAVTGWDDVMAARHARPGLTTVRQPMRQLGAWAARRLHERLAGDTSRPRHEVLPTQLVLRRSCGDHPKEDR